MNFVYGLLIGAMFTTTVEYIKHYNLLDLILDKIKGLLHKS